jgi:glycosyltransferase involved in cell wall biosynthesis
MDRVSVVIPCHNQASYLGAAIVSVINQSYRPFEIIIVDDGSNDGSDEVAASFGNEVRLITQSNRGVAAARNRGVAASGGDVLAFLDADDAWPVESLARRLAVMVAADAELVFGRIRQCLGRAAADAPSSAPELAGRLAGAMLVRRQAFERVGWFDERLRSAETVDWVARADDVALRQVSCEATVLFRRVHSTNMMRNRAATDPNCLAALRSAVVRRRARCSE